MYSYLYLLLYKYSQRGEWWKEWGMAFMHLHKMHLFFLSFSFRRLTLKSMNKKLKRKDVPYFTGLWEGEVDQILPDATTATLYNWQMNLSWKKSAAKSLMHSHHARNTLFWPQAIHILTACFLSSIHLPLQSPGWVELRGGERSAVCRFKVSHVLPCLGERKDRDGGGMENEVWEGDEQKVQNLITLGSVFLAQCLTNLCHLLRIYTGE